MTLVVILTVRRDAAEAFAAHEREAVRVMARYGGHLRVASVIATEVLVGHDGPSHRGS